MGFKEPIRPFGPPLVVKIVHSRSLSLFCGSFWSTACKQWVHLEDKSAKRCVRRIRIRFFSSLWCRRGNTVFVVWSPSFSRCAKPTGPANDRRFKVSLHRSVMANKGIPTPTRPQSICTVILPAILVSRFGRASG
jgi:hypothetical protein